MKNLLLLSLLTLSLSLSAQSPAEDVTNRLVNDPEVHKYFQQKIGQESRSNDQVTSSSKHYTFELPKQFNSKLEETLEKLRELRPKAYQFKETKASENTTVSIAIDNGSSKFITGEPNRNTLLVCFRSPSDSLRRYATLLTWDMSQDETIPGSIIQVYGLSPSFSTETQTVVKILGKDYPIASLGDLGKLDELTSQFEELGSKFEELGKMSLGPERTQEIMKDYLPDTVVSADGLKVFYSGKSRIVDPRVTNFGTLKNNKQQKPMPEVGDSLDVSIRTSTDILREFSRLYTLFVNTHGKYQELMAFQTTILARMDNLILEHGKKFLMKDECDLCIKMLRSMKKRAPFIVNDTVAHDYIDLIIKRIKRVRINVPA